MWDDKELLKYIYRHVNICKTAFRVLNSKLEHISTVDDLNKLSVAQIYDWLSAARQGFQNILYSHSPVFFFYFKTIQIEGERELYCAWV